jgi:N-acetylglucosaminyl-diphospho-decaprenol L-rhamnosyltransferase
VSSPPPSVAVVIVSFNARDDLVRCLDSLERCVGVPFEVVVVDNASTDGSDDAARDRGGLVQLVANPTNTGFARACNQGTAASRAARVLFLNPDAEVTAGAVEALAARLDSGRDVGAVGPLTRHQDGTIQVSTGHDLTPIGEWRQRRLVRGVRRRDSRALQVAEKRHTREQEVDWVSGSCLMARREALEAVGGFDEGFFLFEEDADLCRRLRAAGWRVVFTPAAEVRHRLGQSMAQAPAVARLAYHESHLLYYRKHNSLAARLLLRLLLLGRALGGLTVATVRRDAVLWSEGRLLLRLVRGSH